MKSINEEVFLFVTVQTELPESLWLLFVFDAIKTKLMNDPVVYEYHDYSNLT